MSGLTTSGLSVIQDLDVRRIRADLEHQPVDRRNCKRELEQHRCPQARRFDPVTLKDASNLNVHKRKQKRQDTQVDNDAGARDRSSMTFPIEGRRDSDSGRDAKG